MSHFNTIAAILIAGLMLWALFIRKPKMKKPLIWGCVGLLFVSLAYLLVYRG